MSYLYTESLFFIWALLHNFYHSWHNSTPKGESNFKLFLFFMQNDHFNGIMMGHEKMLVFFISKRGPNSNILHIWKVYRIFYFLSNFDAVFSLNWLGQELSANFLYILWFPKWIQPKGDNKSRILIFQLSYFTSNFNSFFRKMIIFMNY